MTETVPPLNARAVLAELLHTDARIAAYQARREDLRAQLTAEALRRYEAEGAAPAWRVARLGEAWLEADDDAVDVNIADEDAYGEWALNEHPDLAGVVISIPGTLASAPEVMQVAGTLATVGARLDIEPDVELLARLEADGRADPDSGQLWAADGQVVPGIIVTRHLPVLRVELADEARGRARQQVDAILDAAATRDVQAFADAATRELATTAADLMGDPEAADDEGAGDAEPDEDLGAERTSTITIGDPELEPAQVDE